MVDLHELIGAESLSQRYHFTTILAHRLPELKTLVHDDSCHLFFMCREHQQASAIARRLGQFNFVIDRFHATGHVGEFCRQHFLPDLPENQSILSTFPTDIAESVNSQFSPLAHVVHHMNKWFCQLFLQAGCAGQNEFSRKQVSKQAAVLGCQEMCDVHNLARLQALADRARARRKRGPPNKNWRNVIFVEGDIVVQVLVCSLVFQDEAQETPRRCDKQVKWKLPALSTVSTAHALLDHVSYQVALPVPCAHGPCQVKPARSLKFDYSVRALNSAASRF